MLSGELTTPGYVFAMDEKRRRVRDVVFTQVYMTKILKQLTTLCLNIVSLWIQTEIQWRRNDSGVWSYVLWAGTIWSGERSNVSVSGIVFCPSWTVNPSVKCKDLRRLRSNFFLSLFLLCREVRVESDPVIPSLHLRRGPRRTEGLQTLDRKPSLKYGREFRPIDKKPSLSR